MLKHDLSSSDREFRAALKRAHLRPRIFRIARTCGWRTCISPRAMSTWRSSACARRS